MQMPHDDPNMRDKACGPYVVILSNWTSILKWYLAKLLLRFSVKNGHSKEKPHDEIGLYAQNVNTILDSIVATTGRTL